MSFDSILIANRGEIACRIVRTARTAGYRTIAIYSDADRDLPHTAMADDSVFVGAAPAGESYLDIERVIAAAIDSDAGAIHPGYGFLSENADFAKACERAGIVFIGPTAEAISLMGNKATARRKMIEAGVPCLPGYQGSGQSEPTLLAAAAGIGFPIMVKAAAGGGGRGIRLAMSAADLPAALELARSESLAAFGCDDLILERALIRPRHVEIQILADRLGHTIHLGERDCSVQRRHQKVIEEAPCPWLSDELRGRMGATAVEAATSIGYRGAGTVEFLLSEADEFFFMEMNTRLQVEHAVTEMITGLDLVDLQIRIAAGQPLPISQQDIVLNGHAIEARLYAEDPAAGFLPDTGRIDGLHWPAGDGIRVDTGVSQGNEISPFYDPMVAKIIAFGADRHEALTRLRTALGQTALFGPHNNRDFLIDAIGREPFVRGHATTAFVEDEYPNGTFGASTDSKTTAIAALMQHCLLADAAAAASVTMNPALRNWSSCGVQHSHYRYEEDAGTIAITVRPDAGRYRVTVGDREHEIEIIARSDTAAQLKIDGRATRAMICAPDSRHIHIATANTSVRFVNTLGLGRAPDETAASGQLQAPMHGVLIELDVAAGDRVRKGDRLCILEAMKMQHELLADTDGTVRAVHFAAGVQVPADALVLEIEPAQDA